VGRGGRQENSEEEKAAGFRVELLDSTARRCQSARARAAGTLKLERTLSDLVNQAYGLTPAEVDLMRKTSNPTPPALASPMHQIKIGRPQRWGQSPRRPACKNGI